MLMSMSYKPCQKRGDTLDGICLSNLAGGQLEDAFQNALVRVLQNLSDPNTPYKPKREIDIKIVFEQNEERNDIKLGISVKPKLAAIIPVNTGICMFRDLKTNKITFEEYGSHLRGQTMLKQDDSEIEIVKTIEGGR